MPWSLGYTDSPRKRQENPEVFKNTNSNRRVVVAKRGKSTTVTQKYGLNRENLKD